MKSKYNVKPGDYIHINWMEGEPQYAGREGIVRSIDDMGSIHGSWGGLALLPEDDWVLLPLDYVELRAAVHKIFNELLDREFECAQANEFDYEYFEAKTDDILRLIKRQNQNN